MTGLIVVTVATLGISAICSLFEAALYSTRVVSLEADRNGPRKKVAERMIKLKGNVSAPIAAILILNTIANTAGCTLAGVLAARVLSPGWVSAYMAGLVVGILFLSEIIPKTVGAVHWRGIWPFIVGPIRMLLTLMRPLIAMIQHLTNLITHGQQVSSVTEEEILAIVRMGAEEGHISEEEGDMVRNIINLENQHAKDVMTPRVVIFTLDAKMSAQEASEQVKDLGFSRIPIYQDHPENITGYILRLHIHAALAQDPTQPLHSFAKPIGFFPESANCLSLLNQFLKQRRHIAMVADEYGGLAGLLTLEDLVETLLGSEIVDETDHDIDMQSVARRRRDQNDRTTEPMKGDEPQGG